MKDKPVVNIEKWIVNKAFGGLYLTGYVTDHPRLLNNKDKTIRTSQIIRIDFREKMAETLNTIYKLGEKGEY